MGYLSKGEAGTFRPERLTRTDALRTAASGQDQHPGLCLETQGTRARWVGGSMGRCPQESK